MESALTISFDILSFASIIVLVVLGLGVIASMMKIFNFAHGEFLYWAATQPTSSMHGICQFGWELLLRHAWLLWWDWL